MCKATGLSANLKQTCSHKLLIPLLTTALSTDQALTSTLFTVARSGKILTEPSLEK